MYYNQKVCEIRKIAGTKGIIYNLYSNESKFKALRNLTYNETKVYDYCMLNKDGYKFGLSTKDIAEKTGSNQRSIQKSILSMIKKGYFIEVDNNSYIFLEDPDMDISEITQKVHSGKKNSVLEVRGNGENSVLEVLDSVSEIHGSVQNEQEHAYKKDRQILYNNKVNIKVNNTPDGATAPQFANAHDVSANATTVRYAHAPSGASPTGDKIVSGTTSVRVLPLSTKVPYKNGNLSSMTVKDYMCNIDEICNGVLTEKELYDMFIDIGYDSAFCKHWLLGE